MAGGDIACPHMLEERAVGEDGGTYPWRTEIRESEGHGRKTPWPFCFWNLFQVILIDGIMKIFFKLKEIKEGA